MSVLSASRLSRLASYPHLANNWHYISAAILSVCNQPQDIPVIYQYAVKSVGSDQQGPLTAKFREAILKSAALIGLPRTINSLTELKNVTPEQFRATQVLRSDSTDFAKTGSELFAKVYGKITGRIHHQLYTAYPDLDWFITKHEYGPLLSFDKVLDARQTSLVIVGSLVPQDVNPQLKGHLKGALNNGASKEEVNSVRDMAYEISEWCGLGWKVPVSKL